MSDEILDQQQYVEYLDEQQEYQSVLETRIAELETALRTMVDAEIDYMQINNLGDPYKQDRIVSALQALEDKP